MYEAGFPINTNNFAMSTMYVVEFTISTSFNQLNKLMYEKKYEKQLAKAI